MKTKKNTKNTKLNSENLEGVWKIWKKSLESLKEDSVLFELCSLERLWGNFFWVKSYQLAISPGPFAAICVSWQMVRHLFASPVEAHQPIFASKQPVIFSHVPTLVSVCNWTVTASMEFGRRRQGGGGGSRNGNTGLYAGWRNRNDRPSNPWKKQEQWPLQKL